MYKSIIKPFLDRLVALIALVVTMPLILLVMVLLFIFQHKQILFTQPRPGKDEWIFTLVKFKTMKDAFDGKGQPLSDALRLTTVGKWIRKTSLDELPQLINILKGDMSFVGPRPLLVEYLPLYNDYQRKRHSVKPGITGWAQVNGRNAISWEKRFELDVYYVENQSFLLDLRILLLTILKVFKAEGISAAGSVTMEKFKGNN
ncbi:MAG: sugar transferase [Bacteroidota bacterium]